MVEVSPNADAIHADPNDIVMMVQTSVNAPENRVHDSSRTMTFRAMGHEYR